MVTHIQHILSLELSHCPNSRPANSQTHTWPCKAVRACTMSARSKTGSIFTPGLSIVLRGVKEINQSKIGVELMSINLSVYKSVCLSVSLTHKHTHTHTHTLSLSLSLSLSLFAKTFVELRCKKNRPSRSSVSASSSAHRYCPHANLFKKKAKVLFIFRDQFTQADCLLLSCLSTRQC